MTRAIDPPAWLEGFQARFSSVLRTPLDRSTRTLRDQRATYDAAARADAAERAAPERLAVYNRQYWFRLLGALQHELPLTHRLLGSWTFNEYALRFLEESAPSVHDLARAADGLASHLERVVPEIGVGLPGGLLLPQRALVQAARIDDAYRAVLRAPVQPAFAPDASELATLLDARLIGSPALQIVEESWPLVKLRSMARTRDDERPEPLPAAHAQPQRWALCANAGGYRLLPLEPLQAELLALLGEHTVAQALGRLEHAHGDAVDLPQRVRAWLAEGMRLGFWIGLSR